MGKINSLLFLCFVIGSTAQAFEIAGTGSAVDGGLDEVKNMAIAMAHSDAFSKAYIVCKSDPNGLHEAKLKGIFNDQVSVKRNRWFNDWDATSYSTGDFFCSETFSNKEVEFQNTDIFTSYGESTLSNEDARDVVDRKADSHCSSLGHHYYADRASAYKDGSFITYRCNPIYRPGCRDTYKFTSEAKFKCETAGW